MKISFYNPKTKEYNTREFEITGVFDRISLKNMGDAMGITDLIENSHGFFTLDTKIWFKFKDYSPNELANKEITFWAIPRAAIDLTEVKENDLKRLIPKKVIPSIPTKNWDSLGIKEKLEILASSKWSTEARLPEALTNSYRGHSV